MTWPQGYYHRGSGTHHKAALSERSPSLHLQMQVPISPEMDWSKLVKCAVVWQVHVSNNLRCQYRVERPASVLVCWCVSAHGLGYPSVKATQQTMSFSGPSLFIPARRWDTLCTCSIDLVVKACRYETDPDISPAENVWSPTSDKGDQELLSNWSCRSGTNGRKLLLRNFNN